MNVDIIKKILKDDSERLIIIDDGKPKFVVMSYNHYARLSGDGAIDENFEMNFKDLFAKKQTIINKDQAMERKNDSEKELSLDDLPII